MFIALPISNCVFFHNKRLLQWSFALHCAVPDVLKSTETAPKNEHAVIVQCVHYIPPSMQLSCQAKAIGFAWHLALQLPERVPIDSFLHIP